jgi:hypothetical protein
MIGNILMVFAFVLFAIAAWRPAQPDASRLTNMGLACIVLAFLYGTKW